MSKQVLVLGAGLVSQPLIDYLFENTTHELVVADVQAENARQAINGHKRGRASELDVTDEAALGALISTCDLVVSLLPYTLHALVARQCIHHGKSMVNASYVSEELRSLDAEAREKGLLFLCEIGLDPGIDHMSAMQIIHDVQSRGGRIKEFVSVCGGLPAPDANDNPFGYKFSWSPKGVLLAGNNSARYISEGDVKEISADELFHSTTPMQVDSFEFEAYPNRDSTSYEQVYGLNKIDLLMRGTLRYAGWHRYVLALKSLNLLVEEPVSSEIKCYAELLAAQNDLDAANIKSGVIETLGLSAEADEIKAFDWLGLFSEDTQDFSDKTVLDCIADLMSRKMAFKKGERDMVALQHQFTASFSDHTELITSTLIDYGVPHGASSMARTVSLPMAIAIRLILDGAINLTGVQIPVDPIIYEPVLKELRDAGIVFEEKTAVA
ncbi:MAG: saccharopine dehydrogenase NADP-binding domain-containing protein [Candidatus Marinimicrobia bacterium]|nr:saccharopine dehydrogenase NADP-binding domain-containing protein [Candidatus Neomarinimicrobiota bacterium]MCF7850055.1 saccharopine dehydrogenase NADP-binding domain-containing protein [Candidatus Neomarinimicrobiota bacterium]MCF7904879.1 saccharopine dehydrogenase NADP-binding domain-containing protein [Candidatus Neomarinimicrobiota bacterium]